jgi:hypothetical protein
MVEEQIEVEDVKGYFNSWPGKKDTSTFKDSYESIPNYESNTLATRFHGRCQVVSIEIHVVFGRLIQLKRRSLLRPSPIIQLVLPKYPCENEIQLFVGEVYLKNRVNEQLLALEHRTYS